MFGNERIQNKINERKKLARACAHFEIILTVKVPQRFNIICADKFF